MADEAVGLSSIVKYKMGQENGAGICPMVTSGDQLGEHVIHYLGVGLFS